MSKRNIFLRIGVLMLIATLATSGVFVGSGTYAKYIASAQYEATGRVAKFDVRINGTTFSKADIGTPYAVTNATGFLGTLYQENCTTPHPGGASTATINAIDGSLIAPGTGGKMSFEFTNYSEVSVRFWLDTATAVTFANGLASTADIQFASGNSSGPTGSWGTLASALSDGDTGTNFVDLAPMTTTGSATTSKAVYWRWQFDCGRDAEDTALGVATTPGTMSLNVRIKAKQLD